MALYLVIFWIIAVLFAALYAFSHLPRLQNFKLFLENNAGFFVMLTGVFLAMAIITKDPVTFLGIEMPIELQWLVSLLFFGFGSWQFYLNPLKERLIRLERNFANFAGISKANFEHINKGIDEIKIDLRRRR